MESPKPGGKKESKADNSKNNLKAKTPTTITL
jgi:hypothetical protein